MSDLRARTEKHAAAVAEEFLLSAPDAARKDRDALKRVAQTAWETAELHLIVKSPKPDRLAEMTKLADKLEYKLFQLHKEELRSPLADDALRDAREWVTALLGAIKMDSRA